MSAYSRNTLSMDEWEPIDRLDGDRFLEDCNVS